MFGLRCMPLRAGGAARASPRPMGSSLAIRWQVCTPSIACKRPPVTHLLSLKLAAAHRTPRKTPSLLHAVQEPGPRMTTATAATTPGRGRSGTSTPSKRPAAAAWAGVAARGWPARRREKPWWALHPVPAAPGCGRIRSSESRHAACLRLSSGCSALGGGRCCYACDVVLGAVLQGASVSPKRGCTIVFKGIVLRGSASCESGCSDVFGVRCFGGTHPARCSTSTHCQMGLRWLKGVCCSSHACSRAWRRRWQRTAQLRAILGAPRRRSVGCCRPAAFVA